MVKWVPAVAAAFLCATLVYAGSVHAQPAELPVQGLLTDDAGGRIDAASLALTVRLYATEVGGAPLHTESATVPVRDGVFLVSLGRDVPLALGHFGGADVWVSVQVEAAAELPQRFPLATMAHAAWAGRAGTVEWLAVEGVPPAVATGGDYVSGPGVLVAGNREVGLNAAACFPGEMWLWNGSAWNCGSASTSILGGPGIQAVGGLISVDFGYAQRALLAHDCAFGIASIGITGAVTCATNNNTDTNVFSRVCGAGLVLRGFDATGTPLCVADQNTNAAGRGCTAGAALRGFDAVGTPICVAQAVTDTNVFGRGCTGTNQVLRGFQANGTPICVVDQDTNTNAFNRGCTGANQVLRGFDASGNPLCVTDQDANTTYTASTGLRMVGTTLQFADRRVRAVNRSGRRECGNGSRCSCGGADEWLYGWQDDNGCSFFLGVPTRFCDWARCSNGDFVN